jgi:hypothetical protein
MRVNAGDGLISHDGAHTLDVCHRTARLTPRGAPQQEGRGAGRMPAPGVRIIDEPRQGLARACQAGVVAAPGDLIAHLASR